MIKFGIDVELTPEQAAAAEAHWGEDRLDALVADVQGTIKTFFDDLIKEDTEKTRDDEPEEEDGEEVYSLTPFTGCGD
jgi:hypothetical protein